MKVSRWRIVALVAGGVILLPVLFVVIGFWPGGTKDIEAIANEFQPGDSWQLESERITPPRLICLQADCGEVHKVWRGQPGIFRNCSELTVLSKNFTGNFDSKEDNENWRQSDSTTVSECDIKRYISGKIVTVSYRSYNNQEQSILILDIGGAEL